MITPTNTKLGDMVQLVRVDESDIYRVDLFTQWRFIPKPQPSRQLALKRDLDALRPLFLALLKEVDRG